MQHGIVKENEAREKFIEETDFAVGQSGIFTDKHYPFLAAWLDGFVNEDFVLQVKCPYTAHNMKIEEAVEQKIIICLNKTVQMDVLKLN